LRSSRRCPSLLGATKAESHVRGRLATVSGLVVSRVEVSSSASTVTRGTGGRLALAVVGLDREASVSEERGGAHVDAGQIPVDERINQSVLELEDIRLALSGG